MLGKEVALDFTEIEAKTGIDSLALFGGSPLFDVPRSTSNLLKPDIDKFFHYSRMFYEAGRYTNNGPVARLLEKRLAAFHKVEHCLVFASGFWAIALAMRCLALEGRNEVIMPSLTYRRMADIAAWLPLKPHYCEVDPHTLAMTPDTVEASITENTALILGVHPIVNCCDAQGLEDLGRAYDIPVLFDSVESIYETLPEGRVGGFGEAECFSLHACKLLNGFGGGYLTSNNHDLIKKLASLRNFGFTKPDTVDWEGGLNAKLNEMHAAMALASLDDLSFQILRNRNSYEVYKNLLADISGIRLIAFNEERQNSFKNIVVELNEYWPLPRDVTIQILNAENILARAYYAPPLHQKAIHIPHVASPMPVSENLAERFLNMPCGQRTSVQDIRQTVGLMRFLEKHADTILNRFKETS